MAKIFVYCPRKSTGALELVKGLEGVRLRKFDGEDFWNKGQRVKIPEGSVLVCWGATVPELDGVRVLNSMDVPMNKFKQAELLIKAGVPTIEVRRKDEGHSHANLIKAGYIPRSNFHVGGEDLLFGVQNVGFYTKKMNLSNEYRIHSFNGKSIRAGQKIVREGFNKVDNEAGWKPNANMAHPWVRSFDGGWRINYDGFQSTQAMRGIAHKAITALGLTFGAVDIGQRTEDNKFIVLEVNTAPGIEGGSLAAYVRAIKKWIENPVKAEEWHAGQV